MKQEYTGNTPELREKHFEMEEIKQELEKLRKDVGRYKS